jgi:hypothetical protein
MQPQMLRPDRSAGRYFLKIQAIWVAHTQHYGFNIETIRLCLKYYLFHIPENPSESLTKHCIRGAYAEDFPFAQNPAVAPKLHNKLIEIFMLPQNKSNFDGKEKKPNGNAGIVSLKERIRKWVHGFGY